MPKIKFDFEPSPYQLKIFDFIKHGNGNGVISATAGSGKTSTIVSAIKLIPSKKKCLFIAFNKSIVEELNKKLKDCQNVSVRTAHSLGFIMLKRNSESNLCVDEYKYRTFVKNNISELTTTEEGDIDKNDVENYIETICHLIDYSRFNLAQTEDEIMEVSKKYALSTYYDECKVVEKCLEWGKKNIETIDYTDMVWLPVELQMKPIGLQYDWVMIDECQDLSLLNIELFKKCFKRGSRFLAVGDKNQSIYAFAGASEEAFDSMCNYPNTTVFELPISYRCDKKIVELSNAYVPSMLCRENAGEGVIKYDAKINEIKNGDMVLARSKSPLLQLYIKLLRKGINCFIKGNDIGLSLIKLVETINKNELNVKLDKDGLFLRLYEKLFDERNKLMDKRGLDYDDATFSSKVMDMYDSINALTILSERCKSKNDLIFRIKSIFSEKDNGVCLSTIHKAKGLEAKNVYILCRSSMPSKLVKQKWEKEQENNLIYVAYTRAKNKLGFISEKEIPPSGSTNDPMEIITELSFIENKISKFTGKEPRERLTTEEIARFKLKSKTDVNKAFDDSNTITLSENEDDDYNDDMISESEVLKDNSTEALMKKIEFFIKNNDTESVISLIKKMDR